MGGNPAKEGNKIAQASLAESQRQYNEQKAKEKADKERAKANASASRTAGNMAYANNAQVDNTLSTGGGGFSLIQTATGTPSVLGTLIGGGNNKLGG